MDSTPVVTGRRIHAASGQLLRYDWDASSMVCVLSGFGLLCSLVANSNPTEVEFWQKLLLVTFVLSASATHESSRLKIDQAYNDVKVFHMASSAFFKRYLSHRPNTNNLSAMEEKTQETQGHRCSIS